MDLEKDEAINFDDLLKKALTLIGAKDPRIDFARTDRTREKISDFVDKSTSKACVLSFSYTAFLFLESAFQLPVVSIGISSLGLLTKKSDEKIDNLTDMI